MSGPIKVSLWSCFTVFIFSHLSASNQFWGGCSARAWCLCGKSLTPWATPRQQQPFFFPCCALHFIQNGLFPFPRSPLSSPVVDSYSIIKAQLKYPSILGKHSLHLLLQAEPVSPLLCLYLNSMALVTGGLYVVMCGKVFVPWGGPLESGDNAFVISESPVLCWIMVYCHLKSTTVDREEGVCNGSAVNTPVFCTRSSNPFLDGKWCVTFLFFPSFY